MINRAQLRGKPLDSDCRRASKISRDHDDRIFCYGLYEDMSDWEIQKKCKECGAYVGNAESLERKVIPKNGLTRLKGRGKRNRDELSQFENGCCGWKKTHRRVRRSYTYDNVEWEGRRKCKGL